MRPPFARRSIASSRAAGSSSARSWRRSRRNSPRRPARRTCGGRRHGHRRPRARRCARLGIGPGDEVITAPLSAAFSALAIMMAGATPVFADIDPDRLTIDPARRPRPRSRRARRRSCRCTCTARPRTCRRSRRSRARHNLAIVEDACQAHLATSRTADRSARSASRARSASIPRRTSARWATAARSSRSDAALADRIKRLRNGGQTDRYHHVEFGVNSRLDELQAAILRARLPLLAGWTARRRALAARYRRGLDRRAGHRAAGVRRGARLPSVSGPRLRGATRCKRISPTAGIGTLVHYPIPIPRQAAMRGVASAAVPDRRTGLPARCARCRSIPPCRRGRGCRGRSDS